MSVGRARARSMVAGLEGDDNSDVLPKASSVESINQQALSAISTPTQGTPIQAKTASIKCRPTSSRITAAELEDLFSRQQSFDENSRYAASMMMTTSRFQSNGDTSLTPQASPSKGPLTYANMAELKRKKTKNGTLACRAVPIPTVGSDLKRNFHSTPDLAATNNLSGSSTWSTGSFGQKNHLSQEDMQSLHSSIQRLNLPPPDHPPPPIPVVGQVVKVDVSRKSDYESTTTLQAQIQAKIAARKEQQEIASSFKPSSNAKMYASPQDLNIKPSMAFRAANNGTANVTANGVQNQNTTPTTTTNVLSSSTTNASIQQSQQNEQVN
jgi:SH3 and multiple ankyrin repeat domains protein